MFEIFDILGQAVELEAKLATVEELHGPAISWHVSTTGVPGLAVAAGRSTTGERKRWAAKSISASWQLQQMKQNSSNMVFL